MARILEFKPRRYGFVEPETQFERFDRLRTRTLATIRDLVNYYKSTDKWNPSCEPHVVRAIEELNIVCNKLAGAEYAEPAPSPR